MDTRLESKLGLKQRHGCLTTWLIFTLIINSLTALVYIFGQGYMETARASVPNQPILQSWYYYLMACFGIINLICTIALLRWKKWGFWGFGLSSIVIFVFNFLVAQLGLFNSLLGLLGTVLLYIVLQIGNQNKGWPQLE